MKTKHLLFTLLLTMALFPAAGVSASQEQPNGSQNIVLNFKGASLDTVLEYLSQAAGFVIIKLTEVEGTIDAWSHQPITRDEAVDLLNTILHEKGYAAIRNGRTLTIVQRDEARTRDLPVKTGNVPESIPKTDEMVTQVIPVRYTKAMDLITTLQPLLPSYATMSANESSNAIIITDTQSNIRRMVEIISALDTSIASISSIRVFALKYTEATDLATIINELFKQEDDDQNRRRGRGGFPFGPGGRGGDDNNQQQTDSEALKAASKVVAVADETTNSLIVNAPEEYMPLIESLIQEVDIPTTDITEIRVFHLKYANAPELAQQIEDLFSEQSSQNQQFAPRFGRGGFFGGGRQNNNQSERQLQQSTVRTVADPRTNSVVVFAAQETMYQIAQMIEELDNDPSKKQKVFVYPLEYADVDNMAEILRNIFENQNTMNVRNRQQNTNQNSLNNRTLQTDINQNNQGRFNQR
jgi:general secretion pathway protein D